ncbi:MAG: hypothetical protein NXI04_10380 [Planctomycetaceae bacterium]|nr:hypothetical protein [Planctomycetaceae bacterium]
MKMNSHSQYSFLTLAVSACLAGLMPAAEGHDEGRPGTQHVIVVVGAAGTEEFGQQFAAWASRWEQAAARGDASCQIIGVNQGEGTADAERLVAALHQHASLSTQEPLWLVLIGHGTFDSRAARFNLRGPDISATQLSDALENAARPLAVINCSSSSSPFVNALSGPGRTIVTATKDGSEHQFARFGAAMSEAVLGLEADIDRDGQTSLLEAWLFAARRTSEYYEGEGRLATEHSLLDDSGDGKGTRSELFDGVRVSDSVANRNQLDGRLAARWHLVRSEEEKRLSPEQRRQRDELEQQLESLRTRRAEYSEADYLVKLEKLMVPLAKIYREVWSSEEGAPTGEGESSAGQSAGDSVNAQP